MFSRKLTFSILFLFLIAIYGCNTITESTPVTDTVYSSDQIQASDGRAKVEICHATSSKKNPWVLISISEKAVQKHIDNHGDRFPGDRIDDETVLSDLCEVVENDINEGDGDDTVAEDNFDESTDGDGTTCVGGICF